MQPRLCSDKPQNDSQLQENKNESHSYVPFYTWIYWYTYYKTVLKELDNNSIFIAISSTIQYKYKNAHRMVCCQATVQIENKGTVETEELKSVTLLCKNNLLF